MNQHEDFLLIYIEVEVVQSIPPQDRVFKETAEAERSRSAPSLLPFALAGA